MPPFLSIVICTYNRAALLKMAIESVVLPNKTSNRYEIIVVDNNSTDDTRTVIEDYAAHYSQIHYVFEKNQGLSFARNRGWKEAKGEYVIYLDDDAKAKDGWLSAAAQVAEELNPDLFGGPFFAFYLQSKPKWFKDQYGSHSLGENSRYLNPGEFLTGGNMAIRRSLLQKLNGFKNNFGMSGNKIAFGEETELQIRIRLENPNSRIYYEPNMSILHLVRPEKMRISYLIKQIFSDGRDTFRIFEQPDFPKSLTLTAKVRRILSSLLQLVATIVRIATKLTFGLIFFDRNKYNFPDNYIVENCLPLLHKFAYLKEYLNQILITQLDFQKKNGSS